jgi:hypothetical protein
LNGLFDSAKTGFEISLGLVGVMSLWLGIMKIGERGGLIQLFGRLVAPSSAASSRHPARPPGQRQHRDEFQRQHARPGQRRHAAGPEGHARIAGDQPAAGYRQQPDDHVPGAQHGRHHADPHLGHRHPPEHRAQAGLVGFNAADIFLPTLLGTFVSFCAGLVAVAVWQRINLFSRPVLAFFAGFAALMGGLYAWLAGLPPERMAQMIGLLGSGLIVHHRPLRRRCRLAAHRCV